MPPCAPLPISDRVPAFLSLTLSSALPTPLATVAPCCFVKHTTFFPTRELFPVHRLLSSPLLIPQDSAQVSPLPRRDAFSSTWSFNLQMSLSLCSVYFLHSTLSKSDILWFIWQLTYCSFLLITAEGLAHRRHSTIARPNPEPNHRVKGNPRENRLRLMGP